jgi:hypothetical protein
MGKPKKNRINTNVGFQQPLEDQILDGRVAKSKNKGLKLRLRAEEENVRFLKKIILLTSLTFLLIITGN